MVKRHFLLLLIFILVTAGCSWIVGHPPYSPMDYQLKIDNLVAAKDYDEALEETKRALRYYPQEGFFHLRKAELCETLGKRWSAAWAYKRARRVLPTDSPWYLEITYRYGLFLALTKEDVEGAKEMLAELHPGSPFAVDLRGVIALSEGEGRDALLIFNESAGKGLDKEVASRISLHAAMTYHLLGDPEKTRQFLYQAVNLAGRTLIIPQIEAFWDIVKESDSKHDGN